MRFRKLFALLVLTLAAAPWMAAAQTPGRINPMIALHEQNLPVFGVTHPAIFAGGFRRGGPPRGGAAPGRPGAGASQRPNGAAPMEEPSLTEAAKETMAYTMGDYEYDSFHPEESDRFLGYVAALIAAGGSMHEHPFIAKIPIVHNDPETAKGRIVQQLNAGHSGVIMQEVETADEVRQAISAMRFRSKGGTRPEEGIGLAAAYWGLSKDEYLRKADLWPLDPDGELVLWVIIESKKGIANAREIAAVPGVTVVTVGAGTLGGVFSSTNAAGERVRDQSGFDDGVAKILAACKEFSKPCGYPANNTDDINRLMDMGFDVFVMQRRGQEAFDAVKAGRKRAGRPLMN